MSSVPTLPVLSLLSMLSMADGSQVSDTLASDDDNDIFNFRKSDHSCLCPRGELPQLVP